jgi:hypothetical protein
MSGCVEVAGAYASPFTNAPPSWRAQPVGSQRDDERRSRGGLPPEQRRWTWEYPVGPRWLFLGDIGFDRFYDDDIPLALCAEIEGLFVDLPPRPRELFTLVGCAPAGALADVLDRLPAEALGTGRAWLGDVSITAPAPPPGTPPPWWGEDLGDVVVLAQRPNITAPETVDIDLDGFVRVYDRTDAVVRPDDLAEFVLLGRDEAMYGTCRDVTGVFAIRPDRWCRRSGCSAAGRNLRC